mgnify:CR=1 FL=1
MPHGRTVLAGSTSTLNVLDTETGAQTHYYSLCSYDGQDRAALATAARGKRYTADSEVDQFYNNAITTTVDGKGLVFLDLREKLPVATTPRVRARPIRPFFAHSTF